MHRNRHGLLRDLGIAVRDRDGVLLVKAHQHFGIAIAEIVDETVVEAAIRRAGNQRDITKIQLAQHFGHGVRTPSKTGIGGTQEIVLAGKILCRNFKVSRQAFPGCAP